MQWLQAVSRNIIDFGRRGGEEDAPDSFVSTEGWEDRPDKGVEEETRCEFFSDIFSYSSKSSAQMSVGRGYFGGCLPRDDTGNAHFFPLVCVSSRALAFRSDGDAGVFSCRLGTFELRLLGVQSSVPRLTLDAGPMTTLAKWKTGLYVACVELGYRDAPVLHTQEEHGDFLHVGDLGRREQIVIKLQTCMCTQKEIKSTEQNRVYSTTKQVLPTNLSVDMYMNCHTQIIAAPYKSYAENPVSW